MPAGKKGKKANERLDKYYYLAKEQGYRARSAFKLMQLNKKFDFLGRARALIDLCAAPGGWLQVAQKHMPVSSVIIGVDLVPIKPIPNVITFAEDITTQQCRAQIKKALKGWKADVVLHDGSPNVGQSWAQDAYTQSELVLSALRLATECLTPNGWFITKVFRSKDYNALMTVMAKLFRRVNATKPAASRNASAEIFVVCEGFKAPKHMDQSLIDPKNVFKYDNAEAGAMPGAPMQALSAKPKAQGYDDDLTQLLERKVSVAEFLEVPDALKVLTTATSLVFDDAESSVFAANHPMTSADMKESFKDIRLLGKTDFKRILRWRQEIKKALAAAAAGPADKKEKVPETAEQKESRLVKEMDERVAAMERQEKRRLKKQAERAKKFKKVQEGQVGETAELAGEGGNKELFELSTIPSEGPMAGDVDPDIVLTDDEAEERQAQRIKEVESKKAGTKKAKKAAAAAAAADPDVMEIDEENKIDAMEEQLDQMYESYKTAKVHGAAKRIQVRVNEGRKTAVVIAKAPTRDNSMVVDKVLKPEALEDFQPDLTSDPLDFTDEKVENKLLVDLDDSAPEPATRKADMWFSGGAFDDLDMDAVEDDDEVDVEEEAGDEAASSDVEEKKEPPKKRQRSSKAKGSFTAPDMEPTLRGKGFKVKGENYEVVPAIDPGDYELASDNDSDEEFAGDAKEYEDMSTDDDVSDEDEDKIGPHMGKEKLARMLAMGQKIALSKRARARLEDDAYNRYAFADEELPEWFSTDEKRNSKPTLPVTREEIDAIKERLLAINARPMRKIAEAEGRKLKRANAKMQKMKAKQMQIETSEDMNAQEKARAISRMYKRAQNKKKGTILVNGKTKQKIGGAKSGRTKLVDVRMKKDSRGQSRAKEKLVKAAKGRRASVQKSRQKRKQ